MKLISNTVATAFAAAALGACAATGTASSNMMPSGDCFSATNWRGWSSPTDDVIYLRVGVNDIYRVDLLPRSGRLDRGGQFLISESVGSNRVCSVNDLDLAIATTTGFRTPLFPRTIRKLTAEEVAALPPGDRP